MGRYRALTVAVAVGVVGLLLELIGLSLAVRWMLSVYAAAVAAVQAWYMFHELMTRHFGIDIVAIAAIVSTLVVGEYWASFVIVLMLTGGEALESYAGHRARRELNALASRVPQQAHRVLADGLTTDVAVADIAIDDMVSVRPAEVVPVDGVLVSASALLDESPLTGESLPVEHSAGDALLSGSINGERAITMRVSAVASNSQYQRIVQLVQAASESRAPMVRLADRYAVPFTAVAFAIAGVAWVLAGNPVRFAEVLVVATPCPLLIAAPVAFIAGISRAARNGVIVRSGGTLETLSRIRTAAFDKTGTLTYGRPELVEVHPQPGFTENELLILMASAEQHSTHVLASSIVTASKLRGLGLRAATDVREVTASGIVATVGAHVVTVGKRSFVRGSSDMGLIPPPPGGEMAVYALVDGAYAGEVILADRVRGEAADMMAQLAATGIQHTLMLTGDLGTTAHRVASQLGITEVAAECLPEDKVAAVRGVTARPVMMVGDGVNDAPVLAAADVGVAMAARGTTAASESADVVIMLDDISRVARAVTIGRQTTNIAVQAMVLGMTLSVALMFVAMFGVLPAILGAALQEVVDVLSILFALRAIAEHRDRKMVAVGRRLPVAG